MNIESINNPRVKEWIKLSEKKYRDKSDLFLVEGDHLVEEAKKHNIVKEVISTEVNIPADYYIPISVMKKISNQQSTPKVIAVCEKIKPQEIQGNVLVLDGIQDPGNLGTIIRSSVAFNFPNILLSFDSVDLYNEKVIRASEGMIFNINIIRCDLNEYLPKLADYQILSTNVSKGKNIKKVVKSQNIAIIIGNEGNGVKESISSYANDFIKINMNNACESLNAGVSASILMYEVNEANNE